MHGRNCEHPTKLGKTDDIYYILCDNIIDGYKSSGILKIKTWPRSQSVNNCYYYGKGIVVSFVSKLFVAISTRTLPHYMLSYATIAFMIAPPPNFLLTELLDQTFYKKMFCSIVICSFSN